MQVRRRGWEPRAGPGGGGLGLERISAGGRAGAKPGSAVGEEGPQPWRRRARTMPEHGLKEMERVVRGAGPGRKKAQAGLEQGWAEVAAGEDAALTGRDRGGAV